jgi:hypothetical protein
MYDIKPDPSVPSRTLVDSEVDMSSELLGNKSSVSNIVDSSLAEPVQTIISTYPNYLSIQFRARSGRARRPCTRTPGDAA